MLPWYKKGSTRRGKPARVDHSYVTFCPVCRHVIIPYISKYTFANVIMPVFYLSVIASWGGASDLSLTSAFPPPPPQEITAEGRKWKRVSQAGYDWNQSAQWQQHPHETGRQQSVRRLGPSTPSTTTKRTLGSSDQIPENLLHWKLVEWNMISVYINAPM